jgi:S1 RNA binding domain/Zc3h12a-like Ribonuclease NYN domain
MPNHVVVDGSNIATEGRSLPSLAQLNEAVMAFMAEYPDALITVVVDATFGHRIDPKESAEFDEAVANNELVAPPAGAVGRGDAFVISIANKVNATILSNDSYQEFHGQIDWLFDEGRLIGGKPVPHVGWVFVPRVPVRGAISRGAVKDAKRKRGSPKVAAAARQGSAAANQPMPIPKSPPPSARPAAAAAAAVRAEPIAAPAEVVAAAASATTKATAVNDFLPFLAFVEHHPVGSSVNAVVESYSSHGAYVRVGDVKGYVPLRLMSDPAPRSAREFMKVGDAVTLVVDSFAAARRSIDLAVAGMSTAKPVDVVPVKATRPRKQTAAASSESKPKAASKAATTKTPALKASAAKPAGAKASATKAAASKLVAAKPATKKVSAKKTAASNSPTSGTTAGRVSASARAAASATNAGKPAKRPTRQTNAAIVTPVVATTPAAEPPAEEPVRRRRRVH